MTLRSTAALLPVGITEPTAWSAYKYVFNEIPWSLRFDGLSPVRFDLEDDGSFLECLKGAGAYGYPEQARAHLCGRIADIVDAMGEKQLRHRHIDTERLASSEPAREAALLRMREAVQARIKMEVEDRFDVSVATWAEEVDFQLFLTNPGERRDVERFLGADQIVSAKVLRKAVKYVFTCLDLRVGHYQGQPVLLGKPRLKEVRHGRYSDQERERAWSLVLRAAEALAGVSGHADSHNPIGSLTVDAIQADIEAKVIKSGSWGLVDVVIKTDRAVLGLGIPPWASEDLRTLIEAQDQRHLVALRAVS